MSNLRWPKMNDCLAYPTRAKEIIWNEAQAADKQALEAYLGCSIEEAKAIVDRARLPETRSLHGEINRLGIVR